MEKFSIDKASKFSREDRFFDVSFLWLPGYQRVVEKLYYSPVRPEAIVVLSMVAGIFSGWLYSMGEYYFSLLGAFFILVKNYLDSIDGQLARAKGITTRVGRFLDSLGDAVAYICLFAGIGFNLSESGMGADAHFLSFAAMLTGFLLCSVYCYYVISYKTFLLGEGINRTDESVSEDERNYYKKSLSGMALFLLHILYLVVYGWQDKFAAWLDKNARERAIKANPGISGKDMERLWYSDKKFLARVSPLCYGTQIIFLTLFTFFNGLAEFLWFLIVVGNGYAFWVVFRREIKPGEARVEEK